jgi:hypothetical protein
MLTTAPGDATLSFWAKSERTRRRSRRIYAFSFSQNNQAPKPSAKSALTLSFWFLPPAITAISAISFCSFVFLLVKTSCGLICLGVPSVASVVRGLDVPIPATSRNHRAPGDPLTLSGRCRSTRDGERGTPRMLAAWMQIRGIFSWTPVLTSFAVKDEYRYWVYIVASVTGTLYTGMTGDLYTRIMQHNPAWAKW